MPPAAIRKGRIQTDAALFSSVRRGLPADVLHISPMCPSVHIFPDGKLMIAQHFAHAETTVRADAHHMTGEANE
jgi:hypothetical protein